MVDSVLKPVEAGFIARNLRDSWPILVVLALLALAPTLSTLLENPFLVRLFTRAVIFAMAAVALNFVLGFGGLVSLMHAGLAGIGAYAVAILAFHDYDGSKLFGVFAGTSNLAISIPIGMCLSAFGAALTGIVSLRTSGAYFIMITLAFNQMLYYFFVALQQYGGDDGLQILASLDFAGFDISKRATFFYVALAALTVELLFFARLVDSRFGVILRATAQNERRVTALGIPPLRYKLVAFAISGAAAGLAGALWATGQQFVSPSELSWVRSGDYIVMAVLGGMGRVWGPVLGAIVFVLLEAFLPSWTQFWQAPFGLVVVLIVVFLKGGLIDLVGAKGPRAPGGGGH
jgi:branched-chain amino acid transport system permease protein